MIYYSDNPADDYDRYSAAQEKKLSKMPRCEWCDEYITDEECYKINGELVCCDCIDNCRTLVENHVG